MSINIDHKDGVKRNNAPTNLGFVPQKQNLEGTGDLKEVLNLRNLINAYTLTGKYTDSYKAYEAEDEFEAEYHYLKGATFVDELNNNKLVFEYVGAMELSDIPENYVEEICNAMVDTNYNYLISVLNNNKNITVRWSKIEGTTSDYIIYHGGDISTEVPEEYKGYKYVEVVKGVWRKL